MKGVIHLKRTVLKMALTFCAAAVLIYVVGLLVLMLWITGHPGGDYGVLFLLYLTGGIVFVPILGSIAIRLDKRINPGPWANTSNTGTVAYLPNPALRPKK